MKSPQIKTNVEFTITFTLTESQAGALGALAGYGTDAFLKCFYTHMGKVYLEPHERGLRELFEQIKELAAPINDIKKAREAILKVKP